MNRQMDSKYFVQLFNQNTEMFFKWTNMKLHVVTIQGKYKSVNYFPNHQIGQDVLG